MRDCDTPTTNLQIEAQVTVADVTLIGEGLVRVTGETNTKACGLYGSEAFDVEIEWSTLGPVTTKVYQGGSVTAWTVAAAAQKQGAVQDAIIAALP